MSSSRQKRKVAVEDNGIKDGEAREEDFYISEDGIGDVSTTSFALTDPSDMEEGQEKEEEEEEEVVLNPSDILEHRMLDQDRVLLGFKVGAEFFFKGSMQIKVLKVYRKILSRILGCRSFIFSYNLVLVTMLSFNGIKFI